MNAAEENRLVRTESGFLPRPERVVLDITGDDRRKLLQGVITNDVENLPEGHGVYAHLLTPKGKIQAIMDILALADRLRIVTNAVHYDVIQKNLSMRIFRSQVRLEDRRKDLGVISLFGPASVKALKQLHPAFAGLAKEYDHVEMGDVQIVRNHEAGDLGFDLIVTRSSLDGVASQIQRAGVHELTQATLHTLHLEAGFPEWPVDINGENLTLEANLNKAISVSKGCYLGQETVARLLSRGHVTKRLVGLLIEGDKLPAVGSEIFPKGASDRPIGTVTRSGFSPVVGKHVALAYLRYDFIEENHEASVELAGGIFATCTELPFFRSAGINYLAGGPQPEKVIAPQARTR